MRNPKGVALVLALALLLMIAAAAWFSRDEIDVQPGAPAPAAVQTE